MFVQRLLYFFCVVLVAAACSGSDGEVGEPPQTNKAQASVSSSTVSSYTEEEMERGIIDMRPGGSIEERYLAYHEAYLMAAGDPSVNPDFEPLQELSTERMSKADKTFLQGLKERGEVMRLPEETVNTHILSDLRDQLVVTDPDLALFQDCYYSDRYIAEEGSEPLPSAQESETILYVIEMKRIDGEWRLNGRTELDGGYWKGKGECVK